MRVNVVWSWCLCVFGVCGECLVVLVVVPGSVLVVCCCCCCVVVLLLRVLSCVLLLCVCVLCVLLCVCVVWVLCVVRAVCSVVLGFVVCCTCMLPWHLPECFVVNTSRFVFAPVHTHKGSGSHFDCCPRPCSSTCRWARLATHRRSGPHFVCIPCSHAHFGSATTASVSSPKRPGSLHRLAHAAGHGHF